MGILASGQPEGNAAAKVLGQPTADQQRAKARKKQEESIAKDGKAFKNEDERQAALRFQEQCHLMLKWEEFTSANNDIGAVNQSLESSDRKSYKNFVTIDHNPPFDFINRLFNRGPDADVLLDLSPEQLSLLVPQVRIFKNYTDPETNQKGGVELPFDDFLSRQEVSNITKTARGRGRGAGLKSFAWRTEGKVNEAQRFQFKATMVLHFQSVEDIFIIRDSRLVEFGNVRKRVDVSFSDLLIPKKPFRKGANAGPRVWDPSFFEMKAVVGWKVADTRGASSFIPQKVRDILSRTFNSFVLGILDHDMQVQEDGSVELSIDFVTLPELVISEPIKSNILFPSAETKLEIERLVDKATRLEFEIENQTDVGEIRDEEGEQTVDVTQNGQSGLLSTPDGTPNPALAAKKQELKDVLNQLAIFDNSKKTQSYRRILGSLYNRNRLRFTEVPKEFLEKQIRLRNAGEEGDTQAKIDANTDAKNSEGASGAANIQPDLGNLIRSNEIGSVKAFGTALNDISRFDDGELDKTKHRIVYFYLGDLVDVVLEGMFKKTRTQSDTFDNKEIKVLLGPLTFYDYGSLIDTGLVGKQKGVKNEKAGVEKIYLGKLSSVSLADVPISLKIFTTWFNENIVNEGLESYTFHDFITDLINELVLKAVKTECYDFAPSQRQVRLTYKAFSAPPNKKRVDLFKRTTRVQLSELEKNPFITPEARAGTETSDFENYVLIYATVNQPWEFVGNYDEDKEKGIYHLFYGNERGIVKRINFKKSDKPDIRTANLTANYNESSGTRKVLRQQYDATVEMVGNNLFAVGSHVRIVPSLAGGSDGSRMIEMVEDLGIGGYFMVLAREDRVESGLYQTDLDVKWQSASTQKKGGTISLGDLEKAPNVVRVGKRVSTSKANSENAQAVEGDISNNPSNNAKINTDGSSLGAAAAFGRLGAGKI